MIRNQRRLAMRLMAWLAGASVLALATWAARGQVVGLRLDPAGCHLFAAPTAPG